MYEREINRAAYGARSYGDIRYSDFLVVIIYYPSTKRGIKLKFYNPQGIKQAEIGDDTQQGMILDVDFELLELGCGQFNFTLAKKPDFTIDYRTRVDIYLFNNTNPWFSGYIMELPIEGTTEIEYGYAGFGFYYQLETCIVDKKYTNKEISVIIKDIISAFVEPKTDIVYDESKIENTGYTVNEIEFNKVTAKKALDDLAEMAQDFVMGVEEDRKFFFRQVDTGVNYDAIKVIGKHFSRYILEKDTSKILNRIYILAGKITSGSNYICMVEDDAPGGSQDTYGIREGTLTIPSSLNIDDAERWGFYQLSRLKDPIEKAKVEDVELYLNIIKAKGKARIFGRGQAIPKELFIKKVNYKISPQGIRCDMDLGETYLPFGEEIVEQVEELETEKDLMQANIKQLKETKTLVGARAYLSVNQNLPSGARIKVLLDTESYDLGGNFANYRFTAPVSGYYQVNAKLLITLVTDGKAGYIFVYKNGDICLIHVIVAGRPDYGISVDASDMIYLVAGDYLELYAETDSANTTIAPGTTWTYMSVFLISVA